MRVLDSCALLDRLLQEPHESGWLEFKANNADPDEIGQYISALSNGAMLADRDRAYIVFGIENVTRRKVGTSVKLNELKKGGESFTNWLSRLVEPRLMMDFLDFECGGLRFSILLIEPTYDRPVRFSGQEFIRVGENKRRLSEFPEHERALWLATGRRKFEDALAVGYQSAEHILDKLDIDALYELLSEPRPKAEAEVIRKLIGLGFLSDNMEGQFNISNLGALLLARDIKLFPSISSKSLRIIKYAGRNKSKSEFEQEGVRGYAAGFAGAMRFIMQRIPSEERYIDGVRRNVPLYPETAVRELVANALIHQDFTITGVGPVVEIYSDRIEITNPGNSLIETDRMLDERRSRNEKLASVMRSFGLCEERGGGLDKTMLEVERMHLPAPEFNSSKDSMRVVLFGPKSFNLMSKLEKQRACFYHCVIRWLNHDYMGNASLRERFLVADEDYQAVSAVISEAMRTRRIIPADPQQGRRNARYIPYWAG